MLKWLIKRRLTAYQNRFDYDVDYVRHILDSDFRAFLCFARLGGMSSYRKDIPRGVYYAAKLTGTVLEDCGPCTQLMVAVALDDDVRLGVQFARAVATHDLAADDLRDEIVKRWGQRALVSLAFAITAARIYPTIKYALGHGKACQRVVVAGEAVTPRAHAARLAAARAT